MFLSSHQPHIACAHITWNILIVQELSFLNNIPAHVNLVRKGFCDDVLNKAQHCLLPNQKVNILICRFNFFFLRNIIPYSIIMQWKIWNFAHYLEHNIFWRRAINIIHYRNWLKLDTNLQHQPKHSHYSLTMSLIISSYCTSLYKLVMDKRIHYELFL
jgi:hypothetical protein